MGLLLLLLFILRSLILWNRFLFISGDFVMAKVLLIGATSSVAAMVAQQMIAEGSELFCLARNKDKLDTLIRTQSFSISGSYCYDFTDTLIAKTAVARAVECLGCIDMVLIAHGDLTDQLSSETNFEVVKNSFDTNFLSVIALLIPISEQMLKQGSGKIGVITSVAGDRGRPRNYTYGAAKGALSIYLQGMRSTLWKSGVEVYDFKLGPVDTPMSASHEKNFSFSTPNVVASVIVSAFKKKQYVVYIPHFWVFVMWSVRNMPEFIFQRLAFLSGR